MKWFGLGVLLFVAGCSLLRVAAVPTTPDTVSPVGPQIPEGYETWYYVATGLAATATTLIIRWIDHARKAKRNGK